MKLRNGAITYPNRRKLHLKDSMAAMNDTFPFLKLPPELRNMIYNLLFCGDGSKPQTIRPQLAEVYNVVEKTRAPKWIFDAVSQVPDCTILKTCQQIFAEAQGLARWTWSEVRVYLPRMPYHRARISFIPNFVSPFLFNNLRYFVVSPHLVLDGLVKCQGRIEESSFYSALTKLHLERLEVNASFHSQIYLRIAQWLEFTLYFKHLKVTTFKVRPKVRGTQMSQAPSTYRGQWQQMAERAELSARLGHNYPKRAITLRFEDHDVAECCPEFTTSDMLWKQGLRSQGQPR